MYQSFHQEESHQHNQQVEYILSEITDFSGNSELDNFLPEYIILEVSRPVCDEERDEEVVL